MQLTLYVRSYPVKDAPVSVSFTQDGAAQRHTYTLAGREYEAVRRELQVVIPDDAKLDIERKFLSWAGSKGSGKLTAKEVFDLAQSESSGFHLAK